MDRLREAVELLSKLLYENATLKVKAEVFRAAKFNKTEAVLLGCTLCIFNRPRHKWFPDNVSISRCGIENADHRQMHKLPWNSLGSQTTMMKIPGWERSFYCNIIAAISDGVWQLLSRSRYYVCLFVYIIMFFFSTLVLIVRNFIVACAFVTCY